MRPSGDRLIIAFVRYITKADYSKTTWTNNNEPFGSLMGAEGLEPPTSSV